MLKNFDFNKMPIVEAVNEIMVDAAKRGASDIHFDPLENVMKIRIRIDGTLIDYALVPNDIKKNLITRIKIIAGMNITESRLPQDGAIKATVQGTSLDLRVSTIPTNMGEKIVIRILDYSLSGAGIENLGFSDKNYKKVIEMINQPNGIILVTGATGTGKSTTVYSILQRLNKESTNIITVEDPVEMNIEGVNQIQANSEIGLDFATALRSILRQDPNIIMIGEIRDTETAQIAIRASITGHLVLSTLHTNDSLNTIERLLDMDVERYLLASSLAGIIAQKLARKLCPHCRIERKTNKYEEKLFEAALGEKVKKIYTANPDGCEHCHNGYAGRIAIQEVLLINQQIRDAISSNVRKNKLRDLVYSSGVDSLLQDGLSKVQTGLTSMEELLKLIELENEDSAIARMGLEASMKLAQEVEESVENFDDEIKAKPIENFEVTVENDNNNENIDETIENIEPIEIINETETIEPSKDEILDEVLNDIGEKTEDNKKNKKKNKNNEEEIVEEVNNEILNDDINVSDIDINNDLNLDDIKLDNNDLNLDDIKLDNNDLNLDDIKLENDDLNLDDIKLDNNDLNLDDIKLENNDLNFNDITFEPVKLYNNDDNDIIDKYDVNNDNEPTIELSNIKIDSIPESDVTDDGLLDDDLSGASDDDIMNLFN